MDTELLRSDKKAQEGSPEQRIQTSQTVVNVQQGGTTTFHAPVHQVGEQHSYSVVQNYYRSGAASSASSSDQTVERNASSTGESFPERLKRLNQELKQFKQKDDISPTNVSVFTEGAKKAEEERRYEEALCCYATLHEVYRRKGLSRELKALQEGLERNLGRLKSSLKRGENTTIFHIVASLGNPDIFLYLFSTISTMSQRDICSLITKNRFGEEACTVLHIAVESGCEEAVQLLLERPEIKEPSFLNSQQGIRLGQTAEFTALHIAAQKGYFGIVQCLMEAGADCSIENGMLSDIPVATAIKSFKIQDFLLQDQVCCYLLEKSVLPNDLNQIKKLLRFAVEEGLQETVKRLVAILISLSVTEFSDAIKTASHQYQLARQTLINSEPILPSYSLTSDPEPIGVGCSRTCSGAWLGEEDCVDWSIEPAPVALGEVLFAADRKKFTEPMQQAYLGILLFLLEKDKGIEKEDRDGDRKLSGYSTLLHWAADQGCMPVLIMLQRRGVKCISSDGSESGEYPIHMAARSRYGQNPEVMKFLIDYDHSLVREKFNGQTPLHMAAEYGNLKYLRCLLQTEAKDDVNTPDNMGRTPLHLAVMARLKGEIGEKKYFEIVKLLLQHGASYTLVCKDGRWSNQTVIQIAKRYGNEEILKLISDRSGALQATVSESLVATQEQLAPQAIELFQDLTRSSSPPMDDDVELINELKWLIAQKFSSKNRGAAIRRYVVPYCDAQLNCDKALKGKELEYLTQKRDELIAKLRPRERQEFERFCAAVIKDSTSLLDQDPAEYSTAAMLRAQQSKTKIFDTAAQSVPFCSHDQGLYDPLRTRVGLFKLADKRVSEAQAALNAVLKNTGFVCGEAYSEGDCFFDACAQALSESKKEVYVFDGLRHMCSDYARELDRQYPAPRRLGDTETPKENWIYWTIHQRVFSSMRSGDPAAATTDEKVRAGSVEQYNHYLMHIQFTAEQEEELRKQKLSPGLAEWGEQEIDGRILCEQLGVRIHVVELLENPANQQLMALSSVIDDHGITKREGDFTDPSCIHIVCYKIHFVPILKKGYLFTETVTEDGAALSAGVPRPE